jgi:hypothetical protein
MGKCTLVLLPLRVVVWVSAADMVCFSWFVLLFLL